MWPKVVRRIRPVLRNARSRVALPQDDYTGCAILDSFFCEEYFDWVFSPIGNDLSALYPRSISTGVQFGHILTGYVDPTMLVRTNEYIRPFMDRDVDVGQRVRLLPPHFGDIASTKGLFAERFGIEAEQRGFTCDISTKESDAFTGLEWLRFLGNSRFTIGARSGASIRDPFGTLGWKSTRLQSRGKNFEAISSALKLSKMDQFDFSAVSPRIFEAASMGVCQILDERVHLDGLKPWVHFLPLKHDFSNLDEVFAAMRDLERCREIAASANFFLVNSGNFDVSLMVRKVLQPFGLGSQGGREPVKAVDLDHKFDSPGAKGLCENHGHRQDYVLNGLAGRLLRGKNHVPSMWEEWIKLLREFGLPTESYFHPWSSARSAEKLLGSREGINWLETE